MAYRTSLILSLTATGNIETDRLSGKLASVSDVTRSDGGIPALINLLRRRSSEPDIIFIELDGEAAEIFDELDGLKDHVSSATPVYGFGQINDVRFLKSLLAIGFKDYFVSPFQDDALDDIARVVAVGSAGTSQSVIGFVGLAGGVGTSLVALNFAQFLAERSVAGVALSHAQPHPYNTQFNRHDFGSSDQDNIARPILIKSVYQPDDEQDSGSESGRPEHMIDRYRAQGHIILVDIGAQLSQKDIISRCDHIIVIGEPDYRSLLNAKPMTTYLSSQFPFAERHYALNKIGFDGRIEFSDHDVQRLVDDQPIMLYKYDPEAVAGALAKPVPLVPNSLLRDRQAFEKLCARCRIALKPAMDNGKAGSGAFASLRILFAKWTAANG